MRRATFLAGALLVAAPLFTLGIASQTAAAVKKPTIGAAKLSPTRLAGNGGQAQLTVKITPNGSTINTVKAHTVIAGVSSAAITLNAGSGNNYVGTLTVGANTAKGSRSVQVVVDVDSSSGVVSKKVLTFTQSGGGVDQGFPPPPPNI